MHDATPGTPRRDPATPSAGGERKTARRHAGVPPPPDLSVQIPGFKLEKRLGAGGMGDVYLARQESLDRLVAVKLLPPELAKDKTYVEHFLKEARSAAKVSHENVMGSYDCGEVNGRYYFVMEYIAGETLFKQIHKQHQIPEARALEITRQVARGLRHALQHGLIHRDIKPKNILITAEGTAKLCDFGLARDVSAAVDQEEEEFLHTTPAYASPEQCRGEASIDHRSDLYSLGISLFEMLTGKRPFQAATSRELMMKQVTEPAPSPRSLNPAVSEAAAQLVLRMLRKQPAERFKDYDELLAAIDRILNAASAPSPVPASPPKKKKTVLVAAAAGALVAVTLAAILLASGGEDPAPPPPPEPAAKAPAVDPAIQRLLGEAVALEKAAQGKPSEYAAVTAKWKALEERFRGTPHSPLFAARRLDFESHMSKEAEACAGDLLAEADSAQKGGRPVDALRALRRFPPELVRTEAGSRVASRVLEIERVIDERFRDGMREATAALGAGRFEEATSRLAALKTSLALDSQSGAIRPEFDPQIEALRARVLEESVLAKKKAETPKPEPAKPAPPVVVAPPPETAKEPVPLVKSGKKGAKGAAPAPELVAHLAGLANAADRADAAKRSEAATYFAVSAVKSPYFRAVAYFLSKDEKEWKVDGPVRTALDEYFALPELATLETLTAEQEAQLLGVLAQKAAACGNVPIDALQFFACAHLESLATKKGKVDPQVLMQARLGKAPASDLWGPSSSVARIEMARFLVRTPGLWLARAIESSSTAADFPTRLLGALCLVHDATFDSLQAQDRWKKLGAGDPAWTKTCDSIADRFKQSAACELCLGLGKFPCTTCAMQGAVACVPCKGAGKIIDPMDGGSVTCAACKGRRGFLCTLCSGQKSLKCGNCDGKKSRPGISGGTVRWLVDLGLCDACGGEGSLFKSAAWPCPACDGNGRSPEQFLKEYAKLPVWLRGREGRSLFNALRWLARHQSPEGFWSAAAWNAQCREPGCVAAPAGVLEVGMTSLGLVAFLGAGLGPDSDLEIGNVSAGSVVRRAIGWLSSQQQPDGLIAHGASIKPVYENLLATYALFIAVNAIAPGEAFSEKDRQALRETALKGLKAALALQAKGAGWGYVPTAPSDSWVTAWGAAALLAARDAGVDVPKLSLSYILQWFDGSTDKKDYHLGYAPGQMGRVNLTGGEAFMHHDTLSAFGGLMRLQIEGRPGATVAAAERTVSTDLPNPDPARRDFCYWYFGTTLLAQRDQRKGTAWTNWTQAVVRESLTLQQTADTCALGSWLPDDRWSLMGGKVYATLMNALTMEQVLGLAPARAPRSK